MDQHVLFAIASLVLEIIPAAIYFHTIYQGKTKPHAFSWFLWSTIGIIGTAAQFTLGAGPSAWALAALTSVSLFIAFLSLWIGEKSYTKSDWFSLGFCLMAIPVWVITENAVYALFMIIIIDAVSYWPTIRKSYNKPDTEPPLSYSLGGFRYFCLLFAVPEPTWQNLMYPMFILLMDWCIAAFLIIRRYQLGLPLHEYAPPRKLVKQAI